MALRSPPKYVFAHFMVGNTYPYTVENWHENIMLAASQDIDGFVLNVGIEDWQRKRVADCFAASKRLPPHVEFKFVFSFDMTSIPGDSVENIQFFREYISENHKHPRMFKHPGTGGIVVSTFSGEKSKFGQVTMEAGWAFWKEELNKIAPVHFVPSFFMNPKSYRSVSAVNGCFNWNGGWPLHLHPKMPRGNIVNASLDSDHAYLDNLRGGQTFMAAVSPWFFTHYGSDSWNKNWIYRGDDWLFVRRWEQLIAMRERIDIVQIISWNDYGESHYIGPIEGAQPNSQAWVDGYPHEPWLYLNQYYAAAFKTGSFPAIIKDRIFMWARPHPKDAASADNTPRPTNWELTDDMAWMVVFAIADSKVVVNTTEDSSDKRTFHVSAGVTKLSFSLKANGGMKALMIRHSRTVLVCNPVAYRFESRPGVYNFNAYVVMAESE